ncbi:MAG: hypothetical protein HC836_24680 [Richelia sp. RM2_1_2]|nr:hypothetical protein [Richelia sp. RM2_1_2]NJS16684.1 hypothetical protein [Nostocaceae cyanobacterium CSU_2_110]
MTKVPKNTQAKKYENLPITITGRFSDIRVNLPCNSNEQFNFSHITVRNVTSGLDVILGIPRNLRDTSILPLGLIQHSGKNPVELSQESKTIPSQTFQDPQAFGLPQFQGVSQIVGACTL